MVPGVSNILKIHILDAFAGRGAVFPVKKHTQVKQLPAGKIFYPDILKTHITDEVIIACVEGHTALVIYLRFVLLQYVNITVRQVFEYVGMRMAEINGYADAWR